MTPILTGFETKCATLTSGEGIAKGDAVMLGENYTAVAVASSGAFCGVCTAIRNGYATVALKGHAVASYSGTAPSVGYNALSGDGKGGVKVDAENGRQILVVAVNTSDNTIEIIL